MSILFDGVNDAKYFGVSCGSNLFSTPGGTILAWIRPFTSGEASAGRILDKDQGTNRGYSFGLSAGNASMTSLRLFHRFANTAGSWSTSAGVTLDQWNHVAVTYLGSSTANQPIFYINGKTDTTIMIVQPTGAYTADTTKEFTIGNNQTTTVTFDGLLSHIQLFRRILSEEEINQAMKIPGSLYNPFNYWMLSGESTNEPDYGPGVQRNGTATSGTTVSSDNPPISGIFVNQ